jgi:XTP/dITP diphosphohydrolase
MDLIIASNNTHKVQEIKTILSGIFDNIYSLKDKGIDIEIEESGETFYDNALIKAKAIYELTGIPALADDSGLEVSYLNGAPGVYSARYAGEPCNDKNNNEKLKEALKGIADRRARFVSEVVLYASPERIVSGKGAVQGVMLEQERGEGGFGYDPLFYCLELGKTFAETTAEEKNSVSHRSRALRDLAAKL